jgi:hypothetical protein
MRHYNRHKKIDFVDDLRHHFENRAHYNEDFDLEEEQYWRRQRREQERRAKIIGLTRPQAVAYLKEMVPGLRHKEEEILNSLERLKLLVPVDFYVDKVLPEEATDIFTTAIPEIIDDCLSIEQILKWVGDDIKKLIPPLSGTPGDPKRKEAIEWAQYVVSTYRRGLKALRRKVKAELEERELQKEVALYHEQGLDIEMTDFFAQLEDPGLITSLEAAGIRYLFQLLSLSRSQVLEIQGIGKTRMDKIDSTLDEYGLDFWGKDPEKKKKKSKKSKDLSLQVVYED